MESKSSKPKSADAKMAKDDKSKTHKLSLKGSSKMVAEFFEYSINTILYQRGVYPQDDFQPYVQGIYMFILRY